MSESDPDAAKQLERDLSLLVFEAPLSEADALSSGKFIRIPIDIGAPDLRSVGRSACTVTSTRGRSIRFATHYIPSLDQAQGVLIQREFASEPGLKFSIIVTGDHQGDPGLEVLASAIASVAGGRKPDIVSAPLELMDTPDYLADPNRWQLYELVTSTSVNANGELVERYTVPGTGYEKTGTAEQLAASDTTEIYM